MDSVYTGVCRCCKKTIEIVVPDKGYTEWALGGKLIQQAMPNLTPGQREFMISSVCEPCFDKMFQNED